MPEAPADRSGPKTSPAMIDETNALPPGTRFGDMEILRTIGVGGFGIVYLARDYALEREVAIKEYMPGQLAHDPAANEFIEGDAVEFDHGEESTKS